MTPVYNTGKRVLEECIASVLAQTDPDWELCLVDDHSTDRATIEVLKRAASLDERIRLHTRSANGGIVAASNDGLAMAKGMYIGLLDHDDVLEPDALSEVLKVVRENPSVDYVYTDEDLLGENGKTREAFRKPDWSPERFRNQMYVCHFSVIRRTLLEDVSGFRPGFDGSQDYDLILRVTERARVIHHIPKVLYHWRIIEGSVAGDPDAKPYAYVAGENALRDHCSRVGIAATVKTHSELPGNYVISREIPAELPSVSVLYIDNHETSKVWGRLRDHSSETLSSLTTQSTYPRLNVRPIESSRENRLEFLNAAVRECNDEYIVLASGKIEVDTPDWCEKLYSFLLQDDVGMVSQPSPHFRHLMTVDVKDADRWQFRRDVSINDIVTRQLTMSRNTCCYANTRAMIAKCIFTSDIRIGLCVGVASDGAPDDSPVVENLRYVMDDSRSFGHSQDEVVILGAIEAWTETRHIFKKSSANDREMTDIHLIAESLGGPVWFSKRLSCLAVFTEQVFIGVHVVDTRILTHDL